MSEDNAVFVNFLFVKAARNQSRGSYMFFFVAWTSNIISYKYIGLLRTWREFFNAK